MKPRVYKTGSYQSVILLRHRNFLIYIFTIAYYSRDYRNQNNKS